MDLANAAKVAELLGVIRRYEHELANWELRKLDDDHFVTTPEAFDAYRRASKAHIEREIDKARDEIRRL